MEGAGIEDGDGGTDSSPMAAAPELGKGKEELEDHVMLE